MFVLTTNCPATLVWLVILAQVREFAVRPITTGAALEAEAFVLGEPGCANAWPAHEVSSTQLTMKG
jgi:hypothetical protein